MRRFTRRRYGAGLVALALLGAAGCSTSGEDTGGVVTVTGDAESATQGTAGFSIRGTIESLPRPTEPSYPIAVGDLEAGAAAMGLQAPETVDERRDWMMALAVAGPDTAVTFLLPRDLSSDTGVAEEPELGFDITQVASVAEVGLQPDAVVLSGDFDEDTLSPDLVDLGDGVVSAGEGEDGYSDLEARTVLRPLGQPLRVAQDGDRIMLSGNTRTAQNWLTGQGPTLADEEAVLETADQLDALGAISGYFLVQPGGGAGMEALLGESASPEQVEQELSEMEQSSITTPFGVVAVGTTVEGTAVQDVVVYHFGSEAVAQDAVEEVERAWNDAQLLQGQPVVEMFSLDEVRAEGSAVIAVLDREEARSDTLTRMLVSRDGPLNYL